MQVDIKTQAVKQLRQTFSHTARHIGGDKAASRYQEAAFDLQAATNFHYRPLWDAGRELYDVRRTRLVMKDWHAFRDPRQYYYGTYTIARSRQQDAMEKHIEFVDKRLLLRKLPEEARNALITALLPLRHVEWGANTNNCLVTAYGWGSALTQATMFHTMDRLGLAQYVSRIGLMLDGSTGESLATGKSLWMEHPAWQGLRRTVEKMMVTEDCFEVFVAQNLVMDGLIYPLVYQQYEQHATELYGPALSLLTEFMNNWFDETSRWVDATVKIAAAESPENRALLQEWIGKWRDQIRAALDPYAAEIFGDKAENALDINDQTFDARLAKLGLQQQMEKAA